MCILPHASLSPPLASIPAGERERYRTGDADPPPESHECALAMPAATSMGTQQHAPPFKFLQTQHQSAATAVVAEVSCTEPAGAQQSFLKAGTAAASCAPVTPAELCATPMDARYESRARERVSLPEGQVEVHGTGHLALLASEPEGSTGLLDKFIVHNAKNGDVAAQTQSAMRVLSWVHLSGQFSGNGDHYRPIGVVEPASSLKKFFPDVKWNVLQKDIEEAKVACAVCQDPEKHLAYRVQESCFKNKGGYKPIAKLFRMFFLHAVVFLHAWRQRGPAPSSCCMSIDDSSQPWSWELLESLFGAGGTPDIFRAGAALVNMCQEPGWFQFHHVALGMKTSTVCGTFQFKDSGNVTFHVNLTPEKKRKQSVPSGLHKQHSTDGETFSDSTRETEAPAGKRCRYDLPSQRRSERLSTPVRAAAEKPGTSRLCVDDSRTPSHSLPPQLQLCQVCLDDMLTSVLHMHQVLSDPRLMHAHAQMSPRFVLASGAIVDHHVTAAVCEVSTLSCAGGHQRGP
jgi:hypothetical protein